MKGNGQVGMESLKELRRRSGAGVLACRRALEASAGDMEAAVQILARRAREESARRAARWTGEGYVASYVHHTGRLAAMVEVGCETDFVARTEEFRAFARQLAEQVAATPYERTTGGSSDSAAAGLLAQPWIRDPGVTVGQRVQEAASKFGESIKVRHFARLDLSEG